MAPHITPNLPAKPLPPTTTASYARDYLARHPAAQALVDSGRDGGVELAMLAGMTLYQLAERHLGDGDLWPVIAALNPGVLVDGVAGKTLRMPSAARTEPPATQSGVGLAAPPRPPPSYVRPVRLSSAAPRADALVDALANHRYTGRQLLAAALEVLRFTEPSSDFRCEPANIQLRRFKQLSSVPISTSSVDSGLTYTGEFAASANVDDPRHTARYTATVTLTRGAAFAKVSLGPNFACDRGAQQLVDVNVLKRFLGEPRAAPANRAIAERIARENFAWAGDLIDYPCAYIGSRNPVLYQSATVMRGDGVDAVLVNSSGGQTALLSAGFLAAWRNYALQLGAPLRDESATAQGSSQAFQRGELRFDKTTNVITVVLQEGRLVIDAATGAHVADEAARMWGVLSGRADGLELKAATRTADCMVVRSGGHDRLVYLLNGENFAHAKVLIVATAQDPHPVFIFGEGLIGLWRSRSAEVGLPVHDCVSPQRVSRGPSSAADLAPLKLVCENGTLVQAETPHETHACHP